MSVVKLDGKEYWVYKWEDPSECDAYYGEAVFALYPAYVTSYPLMAYAIGEGKFSSIGIKQDIQPIKVLKIPPTEQMALLMMLVGDARENPPQNKEYFSKQ